MSVLTTNGSSKGSSGRTFVVDSKGFIKIKQKDDSSVQKVEVSKDGGPVIATRKELNFIEGEDVAIDIVDNPAFNRVDIEISLDLTATTLPQITSNQNNYDVSTGVVFRLSSDATRNITGMIGSGALILINHGVNRIRFTNEDPLSSASNRIITGTGATYQMNAGETVEFIYDTVSSRWRRRM